MGRSRRRVRAVLNARFGVVVAVLVVLGLVGSAAAYTAYVEPGTEVTQEPGPEATYSGTFGHEATVETPNPVYTVGTTLSDRTAYFSRLTPTLDGTFTYQYTASNSGNVTVDSTLTLVRRSVGSRDEGSDLVYWRVDRELDQETATLSPGESVELNFSENVTALANDSRQIDDTVGGTPGTIEIVVVANVDTEGSVNGRQVTRDQRYELGVEPDSGIYRVNDPGTVTNASQQTLTRTQVRTYGPLRRIGGPALIGVAVLGLLSLAIARYRDMIALSEQEQTYLTYETERQEFDDWITRADFPPDVFEGTVVDVHSLSGLVDIAIDSDRRVITDESDNFVVSVDDQVYHYVAPQEPEPSWSPLLPNRGPEGSDDWDDSDETGDDQPAADGAGEETET